MKKIKLLLLLGFIFSCKGNIEKTEKLTEKEIQELKITKNSLLNLQKELTSRLDSLSDKIIEIDSKLKSEDLVYTLVSTINAKNKDFRSFIMVQGNVDTDQNILLYPEMGGKVIKILVKEGEKIKKGQMLIKFDVEVIERTIKEISSRLELAEETYKKQEKLWKQGIGSEIQYLQAKSNKESLEASLENAKAQKDKSIIKSPFDGIVDQIYAKEGEVVGGQLGVIRVVNLDGMYIKADVSEKYISYIKKGSDVDIEFTSHNLILKSKVSQVANFINSSNRSFRVRVDLSENNSLIKPNLTAKLYIKDFEKKGIVIPVRLVTTDIDGNSCIFIIEKENNFNIVRKKIIVVEKIYKDDCLVKYGLEEGQIIVDKGSHNITDGQKVTIYGE